MKRLLCLLLLLASPSWAAIAYLNGVTASTSAAGPASSLTIPYTTAGGSSEALVLAIHNFAYASPSSITWNGIAFTKNSTVLYNPPNYYGSDIWSAPIGTIGATTANLVVTFTGSEGQPIFAMGEYGGVDQTTPILNGVTNTTTTGTDISLSLTTTQPNSWIVTSPNWSNPITITSTTGTLNLRQSAIGNEVTDSAQRVRLYDETATTPGTYVVAYGLSAGNSFSTYHAMEMKAAVTASAANNPLSPYHSNDHSNHMAPIGRP